MAREIQIGDPVEVVSGPHEGRSGKISYLKQQSTSPMSDPEWYALVDIKQKHFDNTSSDDQIAVPVRRLKLKN